MSLKRFLANVVRFMAIVNATPTSSLNIDISVRNGILGLPSYSAHKASPFQIQQPLSASDVKIQAPVKLPAAHRVFFDSVALGPVTDGIQIYSQKSGKENNLMNLTGGRIVDLPSLRNEWDEDPFNGHTKAWATTDDSMTLIVESIPTLRKQLDIHVGCIQYKDGVPSIGLAILDIEVRGARGASKERQTLVRFTEGDSLEIIGPYNQVVTRANLTFGTYDRVTDDRGGDLNKGDFAFILDVEMPGF